MGIIDDYYGGYETLALFTNSDGELDFNAAYESQLPDEDGLYDPTMDPFDRAFDYAFKRAMREQQSTVLEGWAPTGSTARNGKPIYEGPCSGCGQMTTVPFAPHAGPNPPMCRQCHAQAPAGQASSSRGSRPTGHAGSSRQQRSHQQQRHPHRQPHQQQQQHGVDAEATN